MKLQLSNLTRKWYSCLAFVFAMTTIGQAQIPTITVRLNNPTYSCENNQYCLDVEFQSDLPGQQLFGMNVRFFYDDDLLEFDSLAAFENGYAVTTLPTNSQSPAGIGYNLFGFGLPGLGVADYINGAIQLVDPLAPPILISTTDWTRLYSLCFTVDNVPEINNFCPPIVWNLEENPADGGFLSGGDDGVVITVVDPDPNIESSPTTENVIQWNWDYDGIAGQPFGAPEEIVCISLECIPLITCPDDVTLECLSSTDPADTGMATATDVCLADITISYVDDITTSDCAQEFTIGRTWMVVNECGIMNSCLQIISVRDDTPPTITFCPPDITIECQDNTNPLVNSVLGVASATDNCDPTPSITWMDTSVPITCPHNRLITRTWIATDDCGNTATCVQIITTIDTMPPALICPADVTITCEEDLPPILSTGGITTSDNCGFINVIHGGDFVSDSTCANQYLITRVYIAMDECGNTATCAQLIEVEDLTPPTILFCPPDVTIECDDSTDPADTGMASATDNCPNADITVSYNDNISVGACSNNLIIARTWIADDGCGNTSTCLQTIVTIDTIAPPIVCPPDATIECDAYTDLIVNGDFETMDLTGWNTVITGPGGIVINDGTFVPPVGGPTPPCDGSHGSVLFSGGQFSNNTLYQDVSIPADAVSATLSWIDEIRNFATAYSDPNQEFRVQVRNPADDSVLEELFSTAPGDPLINPCLKRSADLSAYIGQTIRIAFQEQDDLLWFNVQLDNVQLLISTTTPSTGIATAGVDNCDMSVWVTCQDQVLPGNCPQEYTIIRTWIATDNCGNSSTCTQTITVEDATAPDITCPADMTLECDQSTLPSAAGPPGIASATDNCDAQPMVDYTDVTVAGTCAQEYTIERTWIATDGCGNTSTCLQTITIVDTTPPAITCPPDATIECTDSTEPLAGGPLGVASATDNCDPAPVVTYTDVTIASQLCPQNYTIERTWTATDACGNTSTCLQIITVEDSTPPSIDCPDFIEIECTDSTDPANTGMASATDNCDPDVSITYADVTFGGPCPQEYLIVRTWIATDDCGNTSTCSQDIAVLDFRPPVLTCPGDITIECDDPLPTDLATATDNCGLVSGASFSDVTCENPVEGFVGPYDFSNWTITIPPSGGSVTPMGDSEVMLVSPDVTIACPGGQSVLFSIPVPATTTLVFHWSYETQDVDGPFFDPFGYSINGTFFQLTDDAGANYQQGVASVDVLGTDIFAFEQRTTDCALGAGATTVLQFLTCMDSGGPPCDLLILRNHVAYDECGNEGDCIQQIRIKDTTGPDITCPADATIECDESTLPAAGGPLGIASATDNCDPQPSVDYSDVTLAGECPQEYTITRTWTATDNCGNTNTCSQTIVVEDTTPPVITCPEDVTIECGDPLPPPAYSSYQLTPTPADWPTSRTLALGMGGDLVAINSAAEDAYLYATFVTNDPVWIGYNDATVEGSFVWSNGDPNGYENWFAGEPNDQGGEDYASIRFQDGTWNDCPTAGCPGPHFGIVEIPNPNPLATDNCGNIVYSHVDSEPMGTCPMIVIRTYIAVDECGNSASCTQTITIEDTTAPDITCPADVTLECPADTDPMNTGMASATDICSAQLDVTISYTDQSFPGACQQEYTVVRTWVATDECGNSSSCTQSIDVIDTTSPVIDVDAMDVTVECDGNGNMAELQAWLDSNGGASATDACGIPAGNVFAGTLTNADLQWTYYYNTIPTPYITYDLGSFTVTEDGDYDVTQVVNVNFGGADVLAVYYVPDFDPTQELFAQNPISLQFNTVNYTLNLTAGTYDLLVHQQLFFPNPPIFNADYTVTINPALGNPGSVNFTNITWTNDFNGLSDDCGATGSATVTFTATDDCGNSAQTTATFTIEDTLAPDITCPADATIECDESTLPAAGGPLGMASATDICDSAPAVDYSDVTLAGECAQEYTIERTWTATDACGNTSTCLQTITIVDTTPPVLVCPQDITIECTDSTDPTMMAQLFTIESVFLATTGPLSLESFETVPAVIPQATVVTTPFTLVMDPDINLSPQGVWNTPTSGCPIDGNQFVVHQVQSGPATVTFSFNMSINAFGMSVCDYGTTSANATMTFSNDSGDEFTVAMGLLPVANQLFFGVVNPGMTFNQVVLTMENSDGDGFGMDEVYFGITNAMVPGAQAMDNCDPAPVVTYDDVTTAGDCPQSYYIVRTWTAADACGNTSTCVQNIKVDDMTAPEITCPADMTIECDESTDPMDTGMASATDNCDPDPVITWSDVTMSGSCGPEYTITRTWVATDACGNSTTCEQTISVVDTTPPMITCPADATIECDESTDPAETGMATATDNCDGTVSITYSDVTISTQLCPQNYTIERTWTALDRCGNSSTCLQTITVEDTTPPLITCPQDITIECTDSTDPSAMALTYSDEASFLGATGPLSMESFEGNPPNDPQDVVVTPGFTLTMAPAVAYQGIFASSGCETDGLNVALHEISGALGTFTFDFNANINSFGINICDYGTLGSGMLTFSNDSGDEFIIATPPLAGFNVIFFGVVNAAMPFNQVVLSITDGGGDAVTVDEIYYGLSGSLVGGGTATDNCDPAPEVTYSDVTTAGDCPQSYYITRTWTAVDACGNSSSCVQNIKVDDMTAPDIECPADVTIECDASSHPDALGEASATDNCDPAPMVTWSDVTIVSQACPQEYTIERTWTATDACGNSSTCLQIITVDDSTPPAITCPADMTIECDESTDPMDTGVATATDNCDPAPAVTFTDAIIGGPQVQSLIIGIPPDITVADVTILPECPQGYIIQRTWITTDACGNSSTCLQTIVVEDTTAPEITCPADATVECDAFTDIMVNGGFETMDFTGWNQINIADGGIMINDGTFDPPGPDGPLAPCDGSHGAVTFQGGPGIHTLYQDVTIPAGSLSATLSWNDRIRNFGVNGFVDIYQEFRVEVWDPSDNSVLEELFSTDPGDPNLNDCMQRAADLTAYAGQTIRLAFTEQDQYGFFNAHLDNVQLLVSMTTPATGIATSTDNCDDSPWITFSDITLEGPCPEAYTIERTWTATDQCGNSSTCLQTITVEDTTPPAIACPADVTIECDENTLPSPQGGPLGMASATDNCDPQPVVDFSDVTIAGECAQEYTIERTWTATDACGNSTQCLQIISVDDSTPPVITDCPADITIECTDSTDPANTGMASATDNCDGAPVVSYTDVTVAGDCPQEYTILRTWVGTDACGNSSCGTGGNFVDRLLTNEADFSGAETFINFDDIPVNQAGYYTITGGEYGSQGLGLNPSGLTLTTVFNGFGYPSDPNVLFSGVVNGGPHVPVEMTFTHRINRIGFQILTNPGQTTVTITCMLEGQQVGMEVITTDLSFMFFGLESANGFDQIIIDAPDNDAMLIDDLRFEGGCCVQVIRVKDTTPPTITCPPNRIVDCDASTDPFETDFLLSTDNCDTMPVMTYVDVTIAGECPQEYTIERNWTATDDCGNSTVCLQIIEVVDEDAPVITFCPGDVTVECDESTDPMDLGVASATDNCDGDPTVTYDDVTLAGPCAQTYTITRTWTVADACGNSTTCVQNILVEDTTAPMIVCPPDITIECDESADPTPIVSTDETDFLTLTGAISMESFEGETIGNPQTTIVVADFTLDLLPANEFASGVYMNPISNAHATDGVLYVLHQSNTNETATFQFNMHINSFGINLTDWGDFATPATLTFMNDAGDQFTIAISPQLSGNEIFFGVVNPGMFFNQVVLTQTGDGESYGIDEVYYGIAAGGLMVSDNCDPFPMVSYADVTLAGDCPQSYTIERTFTAIDECGNSATCLQVISVEDNTAPTITCPEDITIECSDSTDPSGMANSFSDEATFLGVTGPLSMESFEGLPVGFPQATPYVLPGFSLDVVGAQAGVFNAPNAGLFATDGVQYIGQNLPISSTTTFSFNANINSFGVNLTDIGDFGTGMLTFSNSVGDAFTVAMTPQGDGSYNFFGVVNSGMTFNQVVLTMTNTAGDSYGIDEVYYGVSAFVGGAMATDNCDPSPEVSYSDVTTAGDCPQSYYITRTWTAEDACGNTSTCVQSIKVDDMTAPEITCPPDVTIECDQSLLPDNTGTATATDNCDPDPTIQWVEDVIIPSQLCLQSYTIQRTWTATDACGNTSFCVQTIVVEDTTAPDLVCAPDVTIECDESTDPANTGMSSATDNCDPAPVVEYTDMAGFVMSGTLEGSQEVPPNASPATGTVTGLFNTSTLMLTVDVQFSGLTGTTTMAHFHGAAPPGVNAAVQIGLVGFPVGVNAGSYQASFTLTAVQAADLLAGLWYLNVHTTTFPGGEIRAQISVDDCDEMIKRTWTATDACGNSTTCVQMITIEDTTPPTITFCPADITIECDQSTDPDVNSVLGTASATDNCAEEVVITYDDVTLAGECPQEYTITRTWTADDGCGNTSTCVQVITVDDSTAPDITCPSDITIECTDSTDPMVNSTLGLATATDNCDPAPVVTYSDVTIAGQCPQEFTVERTWTATDACGNTSTCLQVITVDDSTPPLISCPNSLNIECDESTDPMNTGVASATDNCDPAPVITYSDVTFSGEGQDCPQEYIIERTWTATDACGNTSTCLQVIFVEDTTPPVLSCPEDVTIECSDPLPTDLATATDNCGMITEVGYSDITCENPVFGFVGPYAFPNWTITVPPVGGSVELMGDDQVMLTSPDVTIEDVSMEDVTIECDPVQFSILVPTSTTLVFHWSYYTNDSDGPFYDPFGYSINGTFFQLTDDGGADFQAGVASVDVMAGDVFALVQESVDCVLGEGATTVLQFLTCMDSGGPPCDLLVVRNHVAYDECGNEGDCIQYIRVLDTTAPDLVCPADVTIECDQSTLPSAAAAPGMASATDNCDPDAVVTYDDVTIAGECAQEYTIERTWTATDNCGNSTQCLQIITVDDSTAPVITCPASLTIECDESTDPISTGSASATDNCDPDPVVTYSDVTLAGGCPQEYTIERTWMASDDCGNTSTCLQIIEVEDTTIPVFECPTNITIECDESTDPMNTGMVSATDNCDPAPSVTYVDVTIADEGCAQAYLIIRVWTVTDACGNGTNCTQTIDVRDTTAPELTCAEDVTISCIEDLAGIDTGTASATDNCDPDPTITSSDVTFEGECGPEYTIVRTWVAVDACGNSSSCIQTISIVDNIAPICSTQDITILEVIDPDTGYVVLTPEMIDNGSFDECGEVTLEVSPDTLFCVDEGDIIVTLIVTDECGNTSTCTANVYLNCIDPCITINTFVCLEGAATDPNGLPVYEVPMRTNLNDLMVLPGQTYEDIFLGVNYTPPGQPYNVAPWNYAGTEGDAFDSFGDPLMGDAGYPPTVVDWVLVSLRTEPDGDPVCMAAALLHNDGTVEFVEEFDCCTQDVFGTFYIVVEHRNHLIVMSADSLEVDLDNSTITYDFRGQQSYIDDPFMFGIFSGQKEILPEKYAMLAGNGDQTSSANADTDINFADRTFWEGENGDFGQYRFGDYNLNGDTNYNDRITWERNNGKFTSVPRD